MKLPVLSALLALFISAGLAEGAKADDESVLELGSCNVVNQVLTQTDGKTLVFANTRACNYGDTRSGLIFRLNKDGELDTGYGDGGAIRLRNNADAMGVLAPDGKLVVRDYGKVLRFDVNGRPDPTFDGDGSASLSISISYLAVSATGKIGILGRNEKPAIQVLSEDGTVDPTFNGGQVFKPAMNFPGSTTPAEMRFGGLDFSPAGDLFAAFAFWQTEKFEGLGVYKVTSAGQIDPVFGEGDGAAIVADSSPPSDSNLYGYAWSPASVKVLADGSVAVGTGTVSAPTFIYPGFGSKAVRVSADGSTSARQTLGSPTRALVATSYDFGEDGSLDVSLQPASLRLPGKIPFQDELAGARFGSNGAFDLNFGDEGTVGRVIGLRASSASVATGPGGTMTLAGNASGGICREAPNCRSVIAISRYDSSGDLDRSFGDGGVVTLPRLRCEPELLGPSACRLPRPRVTVSRGKTSISRDGLRIAIGTGQGLAAHTAAWETTTLTLPKPLRLKSDPRLVVYAGSGTKAKRLGPGLVRYRPAYRTLTLKRKAESPDALRIDIPRGSIKGGGLSARSKSFRLKATYKAEGTASATGYGRVRVRSPR